MDAVTFLRRDHWEMDGLLNLLDGEREKRRDLLRRLRARLVVHKSIEERVLVPALNAQGKAETVQSSVTVRSASTSLQWCRSGRPSR